MNKIILNLPAQFSPTILFPARPSGKNIHCPLFIPPRTLLPHFGIDRVLQNSYRLFLYNSSHSLTVFSSSCHRPQALTSLVRDLSPCKSLPFLTGSSFSSSSSCLTFPSAGTSVGSLLVQPWSQLVVPRDRGAGGYALLGSFLQPEEGFERQ